MFGFLCSYKDAKDFEDNTWLEIEGTLSKATYHNQEIPLIRVNNFTKKNKPFDEIVYPPNGYYLKTNSIF